MKSPDVLVICDVFQLDIVLESHDKVPGEVQIFWKHSSDRLSQISNKQAAFDALSAGFNDVD